MSQERDRNSTFFLRRRWKESGILGEDRVTMPNICQREVEWSDFYLGNAASKAGSKVGAVGCRWQAVDLGSK